MAESITAYPLCWPAGWARTSARKKSTFRFKYVDKVRKGMEEELHRLGARDVIVSTNAPLRRDGNPQAEVLSSWLPDPGVAVYFTRKQQSQVIACDRYVTPVENIHAVELCVSAMRTQQRHGSSEILDRAFTGFTALQAAPQDRKWWDILNVPRNATAAQIKAAYLEGAKRFHPDAGGDADVMAQINRAYEEALAEVARG